MYAVADYFLKKYPVCNVQMVNGIVECNRRTPCCGGCNHIGPDGCLTNCLGCKLQFCYEGSDGPSFCAPWANIDPDDPLTPYVKNYRHIEHLFNRALSVAKKFNMAGARISKARGFQWMIVDAGAMHLRTRQSYEYET